MYNSKCQGRCHILYTSIKAATSWPSSHEACCFMVTICVPAAVGAFMVTAAVTATAGGNQPVFSSTWKTFALEFRVSRVTKIFGILKRRLELASKNGSPVLED